MKVLQLNTFDRVGGAARAAVRLHRALLDAGVSSQMLVQSKLGDEWDVIAQNGRITRELARFRPDLDALLLRLYRNRNRQGATFSPAVLPDRLAHKVTGINPDIVHLHWIGGGFARVETLGRLGRPLVWTLHDSWAFTGGCHVPFGCTRYRDRCGYCPALGSKTKFDISRWLWRRKNAAWRTANFTFVSPSRWLAECASSSSLLAGRRIEIIPNGLDIKTFKPVDKAIARHVLRLETKKKVVLFAALRASGDPNKGMRFLQAALRELAENGLAGDVQAVIVGASEPAEPYKSGVDTRYIGHLRDDSSLALAYSAADVLVAPSVQENFSNVVLEALACGTPCVTYAIGGMPDLIVHKKTGYLARPFDASDLANGIVWVLADPFRRKYLSEQARRKVTEEFDAAIVAKRYLSLYKELAR